MMDRKWMRSMTGAVGQVVEIAKERPDLAAAIRSISRLLSEAAGELFPEPVPIEEPVTVFESPVEKPDIDVNHELLHALQQGMNTVRLSQAPPVLPDRELSGEIISGEEFARIPERCTLKAEAIYRRIEREERYAGFGSLGEKMREEKDLLERAKRIPDCYLWATSICEPVLPSRTAWEALAACFENVAAAVEATLSIMPRVTGSDSPYLRGVLRLLAEAQSALRKALQDLGCTVDDQDQSKCYHWLRDKTSDLSIYIDRYMKSKDQAEPCDWDDLRSRIISIQQDFKDSGEGAKRRKSLLNKVRYEVKRIQEGRANGDARAHWSTVVQVVEELVKMGEPHSSLEFREVLKPVFEQIPEDLAYGDPFRWVIREIVRSMSEPPVNIQEATERVESAQVREVANLIKGRSVVIIGGEAREQARLRLRDAFELDEVYWDTTEEHQSIEWFRPAIYRPDVSLVLLVVRWSSHSFSDVNAFCIGAGKILIRLPGGYNPDQVAYQILQQAGDRLSTPVT